MQLWAGASRRGGRDPQHRPGPLPRSGREAGGSRLPGASRTGRGPARTARPGGGAGWRPGGSIRGAAARCVSALPRPVTLAHLHLERDELAQVRDQLTSADAALRQGGPTSSLSVLAGLIAARRCLAQGPRRGGPGDGRPGPAGQALAGMARREPGPGRVAGSPRRRGNSSRRLTWPSVPARRPRRRWPSPSRTRWLAVGDHQAAGRALAAGAATPEEVPELVRLDGWLPTPGSVTDVATQQRGRRSLEHELRLGKPERLRLAFALERAWIRPVLRRDPEPGAWLPATCSGRP